MAITVTWLNAVLNKPRDKILRKADTNGLSVRVTLRGKVIFTYRYRLDGKQTSVDIGSYPSTSLNEARTKALEIMSQLQVGVSPKTTKDEPTEPQILTIKDLCLRWYEDYVKVQRKNEAPAVLRIMELHLFPDFGDVPVNSLTVKGAFNMLSVLAKSQTTSRFITLLQQLKQAFRYGVKFYDVEQNPLSEITSRDFGKQVKDRDRVLSEDELVQIIRLIESDEFTIEQRCVFWIVLHTGCRHSELTQAQHSNFDLDTGVWTVPRELSKNKIAVVRPLSPECMVYVKRLMDWNVHSPFILPGRNPSSPVQITWGCHIARKMREFLKETPDFEEWTLHDLRRTARTAWSKWTQHHVAELMLGHKLTGVHAVYDRYKYLDEMTETYKQWANYLEGLKNKGA
jgi:integrase